MRNTKVELAVRYALVLMLVLFGANKFLHFMPQPAPPEEGGKFLGALAAAGYIFPLVGAVFLAAALLLARRRVVLGLVLVAPIAVNIVAYHLSYDPAGSLPGGLLAMLLAVLATLHWSSVSALFHSNPSPRN